LAVGIIFIITLLVEKITGKQAIPQQVRYLWCGILRGIQLSRFSDLFFDKKQSVIRHSNNTLMTLHLSITPLELELQRENMCLYIR